MEPSFLEEQKAKLLQEKKRIEEALNAVSDPDKEDHTLGERTPKFPNYGDDNAIELEDNSPNEVADFEKNIGITRDLDEELQRINNSLQRIEEGTYGKCTKCGKEIAEERLHVYPAAEKCITCSQEF